MRAPGHDLNGVAVLSQSSRYNTADRPGTDNDEPHRDQT
jgi:hypothetical protein